MNRNSKLDPKFVKYVKSILEKIDRQLKLIYQTEPFVLKEHDIHINKDDVLDELIDELDGDEILEISDSALNIWVMKYAMKRRQNLIEANEIAKKEVALDSKLESLGRELPKEFLNMFVKSGWEKLITALEQTTPPLLNSKWEFIGKARGHKGVICAWINELQNKGYINQGLNRSNIANSLNSGILNLELGTNGRLFDGDESSEYLDHFKKQLETHY